MKRAIAFAIVLVGLTSIQIQAQERHIHVNGEHLEAEDIQLLDQINGAIVPNGFYWINMETGEWGMEGEPQVLGTIPAIAQYQAQPRSRNNSTEINSSQNGSVVSGRLNGRNCTFASAGGMTIKSCD